MADGPLVNFELYYTSGGLVQVSNDVRRKILRELQDADLSLTDLSHIVGKAQSTLSVHLEKMVDDGLITVHDDPQDSRRKIYSLVSLNFASSKPPSEESMDILLNNLAEVVRTPENVRDALPALLFLGLDSLGLSVGPMAAMLGGLHGTATDGTLAGGSLEETVDNARRYISKIGIGEFSVFSLKPLTFIVKSGCPMTEASSKSLGSYMVGFMVKILKDSTGRNYVVTSSEVFGSQKEYFRFVMEPTDRRPVKL